MCSCCTDVPCTWDQPYLNTHNDIHIRINIRLKRWWWLAARNHHVWPCNHANITFCDWIDNTLAARNTQLRNGFARQKQYTATRWKVITRNWPHTQRYSRPRSPVKAITRDACTPSKWVKTFTNVPKHRDTNTSDKMWPLLLMCGLLVERRRQKSRLTHSKHEYKDTAKKKIRIKQGAKCYFTIAYGDLFASLSILLTNSLSHCNKHMSSVHRYSQKKWNSASQTITTDMKQQDSIFVWQKPGTQLLYKLYLQNGTAMNRIQKKNHRHCKLTKLLARVCVWAYLAGAQTNVWLRSRSTMRSVWLSRLGFSA